MHGTSGSDFLKDYGGALIRQPQDFHHLLGCANFARIGEGPVVEHAVFSQSRQIDFLDTGLADAAGHAEVADEFVENLRQGRAGLSHRRGNILLPASVD